MIDVFYLDGGLKRGNLGDVASHAGKKIWIDVTGADRNDMKLLKDAFKLHPLTAEDLFNSGTRIKIEEFPDYLFCVFYAIDRKRLEMTELDLILGKNFVISSHKRELVSVTGLKNDKERTEALLSRGTDFLFHKILGNEIDNFFPVLESIDDRIERIEEQVTRKPNPDLLREILVLKRSIIYVKKYTFSQREKISSLAKNDYKFISRKSLPYFRDVYDHAIRVSDAVDNYREAVGNTFDVYMSAVSNNMNEVMKTLSIIATIALPLTVISGIYGTNFSMLPGSDNPLGFWVMIGVMVTLSLVMLAYFRTRKWF